MTSPASLSVFANEPCQDKTGLSGPGRRSQWAGQTVLVGRADGLLLSKDKSERERERERESGLPTQGNSLTDDRWEILALFSGRVSL